MSNIVYNSLGQPIGPPLPDWKPPEWPAYVELSGTSCIVSPLDAARHGADLYSANSVDQTGGNWTYLSYGPFETLESYLQWVDQYAANRDPQFYAIVDKATSKAAGVASYLRIDTTNGAIEVGHINLSPLLQRSTAATEAMYLMMKRAFELGFRRYEWKCDSLNARSRAAAQRYGFSFEGIFRIATYYKGRSRDTAWYSITVDEWPRIQNAFTTWLAPENFDHAGQQKLRLADLTAPLLRRNIVEVG